MEFVSLGVPGTVMLCSEWWAYEILTIFASMLGTEEVAAQSVILQTAGLAFMLPLGLGIASASLIGLNLVDQLSHEPEVILCISRKCVRSGEEGASSAAGDSVAAGVCGTSDPRWIRSSLVRKLLC